MSRTKGFLIDTVVDKKKRWQVETLSQFKYPATVMRITSYGVCFGMGLLVTLCIIGNCTWKLLATIAAGMTIQSLLCDDCWNNFTLASVIGTIPLLLVLILRDCSYLKRVLFAMAGGAAIGRVGCLLAGCCSGEETEPNDFMSLTYTNSWINKRLSKTRVSVKPTVVLEIVLQFLMAWAVWRSEYGVALYGVLNLILMYMSNTWRLTKRMGGKAWLTYLSLAVFSVLALLRCGKVKNTGDGGYRFKWAYALAGVLAALAASNDMTAVRITEHIQKLSTGGPSP